MVLCWMWLINIVFLQLPAKEGFAVIRVISHESAIYVTGHVSRESEAQSSVVIRFCSSFAPSALTQSTCGKSSG